jgi:hypothetical protein
MQKNERNNEIKTNEIEYGGWSKAFSLCNDTVRMVVTTEVGPRILSYGFLGDANEFYENPEHAGKRGGKEFRVYGGHRLWVSPEVERSYFPDNAPVAVCKRDGAFIFTPPPEDEEPGTHLQKQIELRLDEAGTHVSITHRIRNCGAQPTELASWALSVMAAGGRAILPLPPRAPVSKDNLLPVGILALWSYTDLADPRWSIGTKYIQLQQQRSPAGKFNEQMGGIFNSYGWSAYFREGHLFVKWAEVHKNAKYPDFGCNCEVYTDRNSLELETLGPLQNLEPEMAAEHTEHWWLFKNIPAGDNDAWIESVILETIKTIQPIAHSYSL